MFGTIPVSVKRSDRRLSIDHSRAVALRALGFISGDRSYLERFLSSACMTHTDLCKRPTSPAHLAAILDFIIDNELVLLRFARTVDISLETVYEARRLVGHGSVPARVEPTVWRTLAKNGTSPAPGADRAS